MFFNFDKFTAELLKYDNATQLLTEFPIPLPFLFSKNRISYLKRQVKCDASKEISSYSTGVIGKIKLSLAVTIFFRKIGKNFGKLWLENLNRKNSILFKIWITDVLAVFRVNLHTYLFWKKNILQLSKHWKTSTSAKPLKSYFV